MTSGRSARALRDPGQDANITAIIDANRALMQRIEPRRRVQIGRLDPALPRPRHAADQDGCLLGSAEFRKVIAQDGRKSRAGTVQHALIAATLRQHVAIRRHQPAAKAAGAPVDCDKGGCGGGGTWFQDHLEEARRFRMRSASGTPIESWRRRAVGKDNSVWPKPCRCLNSLAITCPGPLKTTS